MLIRIYKYLFYKFYSWALFLNHDDTPQFTALFSVVILSFINFLCIVWFVEIAFKLPKLLSGWSDIAVIIMIILLEVPQYFMLVHNGKYKKIAQEFEKESKERSRRGNLFTWAYIIGTFSILYLLVWIN